MIALEAKNVTKRYGASVAVSDVSVAFAGGKLHAVIGENGAGKSTLLKVACGLVEPDQGRVSVEGRPLTPHSPREAIARGVGMVQQHFALIEPFTVLENVMLGSESIRRGTLDFAAAEKRLAAITEELGVSLDARAVVRDLGVGDRQRLEIARVLYKGARVIVLDEPTAAAVPSEAVALYATLRRLVSAGRTVIVVTHKLDEVTRFSDTVAVLRKGRLVVSRDVDRDRPDVEKAALTTAIMGELAEAPVAESRAELGEAVLAASGVSLGRALHDVSLSVKAGEVVGVLGIEGNGQRELVRVLAGLEEPDSGAVSIAKRVSVVHEDRHAEGLVLGANLTDNLLLGEHAAFSRGGFLDGSAMAIEAENRARSCSVVPLDVEQEASALSGGNQQKVVVARAMARLAPGALLVLAHPTRGVDVGAARVIHARVRAAAAAGAGVLLVSGDLDELRELATRVLVMAGGRVVADVPPDTSNDRLGALMLGSAEAAE